MNTPKTDDGTLLKSTDLFSFLEEQRDTQKAKALLKRREQRDADLIAGMHEECRYVIEDIIDKVKKLSEENAQGDSQSPDQ